MSSPKCKVCNADALPSDDYCAGHIVESWAGTVTLPYQCPKHPTGEILTDEMGGPVCKMCLQGVV
jgi:hypothetical protein